MVPTITDAHRRAMTEEGYTLFPNLFTPEEMSALDVDLAAFDAENRRKMAETGGNHGISNADAVAFTDHIAERSPAIAAFLKRPEFVTIGTEFLGPDVDLYWNQTVYKNPEGDRVFPWHQDDAYGPVVPAGYLTLWLAVSDSTEDMGCISVLPGSHRGGLRPHSPSPIGLVGHDNDDPDQGVKVPVNAGDLICFWSLTMHKSGPNVSPRMRKAFVAQYAPVGLRRADSGEEIPMEITLARGGVAA